MKLSALSSQLWALSLQCRYERGTAKERVKKSLVPREMPFQYTAHPELVEG
jgi:hypothetical protein